MLIWLLLFFVQNLLSVDCDANSKFIAIWAPRYASPGKNISLTFYASNTGNDVKVALKFRNSADSFDIINREFVTHSLENSRPMNERFKYKISLLFHTYKICASKTIDIEPVSRNFYVFIQTDKPIYKPDDEVRFRVVVIDKDMKPYHMNNIQVNFIDPDDRTIETFENLEKQFVGVFEDKFKISENTILGDWKIQAIVDKYQQFSVEKVFSVKKYTLPLFEIVVETPDKINMKDSNITTMFYAKYPFGDYVTGNAVLTIKDSLNGRTYILEHFDNVRNVKTVTYDPMKYLKFESTDQLNLEVAVKFKEPESGVNLIKSKTFTVYKDAKYKIFPFHPSKFTPGSKFEIKILVNNWRGDPVNIHDEKVQLKWRWNFNDNSKTISTEFLEVIDGTAMHSMMIPSKVLNLELEIKFSNSEIYKTIIEAGVDVARIDDLFVDYTPKNPNLNDKVKFHVQGKSAMNKILVITSSSSGYVQSHVINCNNLNFCEFVLTITNDMMPLSTTTVYHVVSESVIQQGSTNIGTGQLNENHLNLKLSSNHVKTSDKVEMKFSTLKNSKVFLLAYDKRLKFLRDGNDIKKEDIMAAVNSYDRNSQLIIIDSSLWDCTDDDMRRYEADSVMKQAESHDTLLFKLASYSPEPEPEPTIDDSYLRKNFPENWIFESFDVGNSGNFTKEYNAPDSITTWMVSAFSVNKKRGLALTPTQELTVKNVFFVKINLPYSIRFKEIIKLDILVHNYVESEEELDAMVQLENLNNGSEFQFVEYSKVNDKCTASFNNDLMSSRNMSIQYMDLRKVSFYIRSNSGQSESVPREMIIQVRATATGKSGRVYQDLVLKKLLIEPVGVRDFLVLSEDHILNGTASKPHLQHFSSNNGLNNIDVIVSGDYLSDSMQLSSRFELYPSDCLEQRTSKLKGNVEYYRYLFAKETNPPKKHFSGYYQSLLEQRTKGWNYGTASGYRAYFLDAVASAMEIGALPKNTQIIEKELDQLVSNQLTSGAFSNFGNFPKSKLSSGTESAQYFETAYILIPFLKLRNFTDKSYDHVIQKAFKFLIATGNNFESKKYGLSIAAYVFALYGNEIIAKQLLNEIERYSIDYGRNKMCFKDCGNSCSNCDIRHTSFTALAYIALGDISKAKQLVNWLINGINLNKIYSNTYDYALATEPVAKLANFLKTDITDITVTLNNNRNFVKRIKMTKENVKDLQEIEFPANSEDVVSTVHGYGFCSITTVFDRMVTLPKISSKFSISTDIKSKNNNEKVTKFCAVYELQSTRRSFFRNLRNRPEKLFNVIFEIEMPSGYVYGGIDELWKNTEIKLVSEKRKGTLVQIYYNDFESSKRYCVDVKAVRSFDVKDLKPAGFKVYDYGDKENVAIEFYKFSFEECPEDSALLKILTSLLKSLESFLSELKLF